MDCRVVVEAAVPVYDVETPDEAVRIAISKTGEMLNPDLNYVEIEMGSRTGPSGEEMSPAFIAADEALVALELEMTVFNVERNEHASRIARKEIGQRLRNIPLKVLEVEQIEEEDDAESSDEEESGDEVDSVEEEVSSDEETAPVDEDAGESEADATDRGTGGSDEAGDSDEVGGSDEARGSDETDDVDDDIIPEFEEMVDE